MDKEGLTNFGTVTVVIAIISVLIAFAFLWGQDIKDSTNDAIEEEQSVATILIDEAATAFDDFSLRSTEELDESDIYSETTIDAEEGEEINNG